jgi:hypothetical protein
MYIDSYVYFFLFSLEYALRKFTVLTQGDTICIHHGINSYYLYIQSIEPKRFDPPAGCVMDTSLTVEFVEPLEKGEQIEIKEIPLFEPQTGIVE